MPTPRRTNNPRARHAAGQRGVEQPGGRQGGRQAGSRQGTRPAMSQRGAAQGGYRRSSRNGAGGRSPQQRGMRQDTVRPARSYYAARKRSKAPVVVSILLAAAVVAAAAWFFLADGAPFHQQGKVEAQQQTPAPVAEASLEPAVSEAPSPATADNVVMTIAGDKDTVVLKGEEYIEAGCHATEKGVADITASVTAEGEVDTSTPGDYKVTYTATAQDGAVAQVVRNVKVVESIDDPAQNIPVLMYHYVYEETDIPEDLGANYIIDTALAEQCEYLSNNDYYYPSFQELRAWVDGNHTLPAKSVILTFDDGEVGFLMHGIPVLEKYGVPATSFVIASECTTDTLDYASPYVQFQSHSYNMHRGGGGAGQGGIIHALSEQEIIDDVKASQEVTGGAVALAYPFGDNNETAWKALEEAGIITAFTVKNARIHQGDNPMALNRVRISGEYPIGSFIGLVQPNA